MEGRPCAVMPPRAAPEEKTAELTVTTFYLAQKGESFLQEQGRGAAPLMPSLQCQGLGFRGFCEPIW